MVTRKLVVQIDDMIDLTAADHVEVHTSMKCLWVNVNAECVLRIYNIKNLVLNNHKVKVPGIKPSVKVLRHDQT